MCACIWTSTYSNDFNHEVLKQTKPSKHFCKQSFHSYTGVLDFHLNKMQRSFSALSKETRSHIVFFSGYVFSLFKLGFWWWGWVSTVVSSE